MKTAFDRIAARVPADTKIYVSTSLDIAERIHKILKKKKISQKELAERLNKKESEISKWLSGLHNFTIKSIAKLESELGEKIIHVPRKRTTKPKTDFTYIDILSGSFNKEREGIWEKNRLETMEDKKITLLQLEDWYNQ